MGEHQTRPCYGYAREEEPAVRQRMCPLPCDWLSKGRVPIAIHDASVRQCSVRGVSWSRAPARKQPRQGLWLHGDAGGLHAVSQATERSRLRFRDLLAED